MKKGRWTFLIMVLALAFTAGCGTAQREPEKTEKEEEDKLQIGLSFDSFVIERWQRDRDVFVSKAKETRRKTQSSAGKVDISERKHSARSVCATLHRSAPLSTGAVTKCSIFSSSEPTQSNAPDEWILAGISEILWDATQVGLRTQRHE